MSMNARTKKNGRTRETESSVRVVLTERDLIVLTQDTTDRIQAMAEDVKDHVDDDDFSYEDRHWLLEELLENSQLLEKLRRASQKFVGTEAADSKKRTA